MAMFWDAAPCILTDVSDFSSVKRQQISIILHILHSVQPFSSSYMRKDIRTGRFQ
jgi:hypothetical protein